jgi:hypothetical protein
MNYANLGLCLDASKYTGLTDLPSILFGAAIGLVFVLILVVFSFYLSFRGEA